MTTPSPPLGNDSRRESPIDVMNTPCDERVVRNPLKMDHEALLRDVKHFAPMVRRSTIPYDSLQAAFIAKFEQRRRRDKVRFSMPYCPSEQTQTIQQEAFTVPPGKRRRYQRRNSKTAAMMLSTKQSSCSSLPSVTESDISSTSNDSWPNASDSRLGDGLDNGLASDLHSGIEIAKNLIHAIKIESSQQREESV
mmetsp:Transcript_737/g.1306  ORF Transcript_737/g.1306 Transcript_737/m.1306 type:complete len:194 (-) Transcript_737:59-640(-)